MTTPLALYVSGSTTGTAAVLTTGTASTPTVRAFPIGRTTKWYALNLGLATVTASTSEPALSGRGASWPVSTLYGKQIPAGHWHAQVRMAVGNAGTSSARVAGTIHLRLVRRSGATLTQIGSDLVTAFLLTHAEGYQIYVVNGTLPAATFASGTELEVEVVIKGKATASGSTTTYLSVDEGGSYFSITTPGYRTLLVTGATAQLTGSASLSATGAVVLTTTGASLTASGVLSATGIVLRNGSALLQANGSLTASGGITVTTTGAHLVGSGVLQAQGTATFTTGSARLSASGSLTANGTIVYPPPIPAQTDVNGVVLGPIPPGIPHLKIPFTIGATGSAETVQQNTVTEVVQSIANLCGTRPGTRLMVSKYGTPDPTFGGASPTAIRLAAATWEKRAVVDVEVTPGNDQQVTVQVGLARGTPT